MFLHGIAVDNLMMEDLRTEFKREWNREYLRNIAAFANTDGGTLYIGLADDGTPIGVKDIEKGLKRIPDEIQNALGIVPTVDRCSVDGKECISIAVEKSAETVFLSGRVWVKSGSTTRSLSGAELREKILKDSHISWTDVPATGST